MNAKRPIIEKHDIPAGTTLTTRHGMKLAYGTLWMTWIDKTQEEGVAASMAREILRAELSQDECGEGISLARSIARQDKKLMSRVVCSIPEAGAVFGLKKFASYEAAKKGQFPTFQIGRRKLVPIAALEEKLGLKRGELDDLRKDELEAEAAA